jgi:integrase
VYLSDFALKQFQQLHALTKDSQWAFPARYKDDSPVGEKTVSKLVGDRQIKFKKRTKKLQYRVENNSLVLGEEEWTPHDLRRTGATLMQKIEVGGIKIISRDVVNLCQNHVIGTLVDRVYLLDDYANEKREAWLHLGRKIEEILDPQKATQPPAPIAQLPLYYNIYPPANGK